MAERRDHRDGEEAIKEFDLNKTDLATNLRSVVGNRFLGVDVDPGTKRFFDVVLNQFLPHIANKVEKHGATFIKDIALSTGIAKNEAVALEMGKAHAGKLALATVLAEPIISVAATGYDTTTRLNDLRLALTPVSKGSGTTASVTAIFGSDNEVVQNARGRIYEHLYSDIAGTIARTIVTLPAVFAVRNNIQKRVASQGEEIELELAIKDPEAQKKYLQDRIKKTGNLHQSVEEAKVKAIKEARTEYLNEFETYKKSPECSKARTEILERIGKDRDYAIDLGIRDAIKADFKLPTNISSRSLEQDHPHIESRIQEELKYRFVEDVKHGQALNKNWIRKNYDREGYHRRDEGVQFETLEDGITQIYKKMHENMLGKQKAAEAELKAHANDPDKISIFDQMLMGAASLVGSQFHKLVVGDKLAELKKPIALDLIVHMRKVIHDNKKEHQKTETIPNYGEKTGDSSFTKFIHNIFELHQLDCKQAEIGSRYFEHFREVQFNDDAIFKMADKDLSAYEVAIKHIARAIKEDQMDSIALINLVGQRRIVQKDAKHFGPKGSNGAPSGILEEIHKQCASNAAHCEVSQEQLSEVLSNIVFSEEELKAGFTQTFKGDEKSFLFVLLESQIQNEAAMQKLTGLSKSEMEHLRTDATRKFNENFDAAINAIAAMDDKEIAKLAKYDITNQEIQTIREAAESAQAAGKPANDMVTGEESTFLKTAVANVIMAEEKEGKNFWQNRVSAKANEAVHSAVADALKEEPEANALAKLAKKRHKHESSTDHSLGTTP